MHPAPRQLVIWVGAESRRININRGRQSSAASNARRRKGRRPRPASELLANAAAFVSRGATAAIFLPSNGTSSIYAVDPSMPSSSVWKFSAVARIRRNFEGSRCLVTENRAPVLETRFDRRQILIQAWSQMELEFLCNYIRRVRVDEKLKKLRAAVFMEIPRNVFIKHTGTCVEVHPW